VDTNRREALFRQIVDDHGRAIARLCAGYQRDDARRSDLEQEILLNVWRALPSFRGDASLRTWMYRVAHNVATRHVTRAAREPKTTTDERTPEQAAPASLDQDVDRARAQQHLRALIAELKPLDRQLILLYLEDVAQPDIAEITGLTQANVSTRIHRIKTTLAERMTRR